MASDQTGRQKWEMCTPPRAKIKGNISRKNFQAAFRNKNLTLRYSRRNCKQTELIQIRGEPGAFSHQQTTRTQHCVSLYFFPYIKVSLLFFKSSSYYLCVFLYSLWIHFDCRKRAPPLSAPVGTSLSSDATRLSFFSAACLPKREHRRFVRASRKGAKRLDNLTNLQISSCECTLLHKFCCIY